MLWFVELAAVSHLITMDSYESLDAWKLAHDLCIKTMRACHDHYHPRSLALFNQLRRAAISIETNIVEGYALGTPAYFAKHVRIAFGSAAEVDVLLRDIAELGYLPDDIVNELRPLVARCLQTLRGLLRRTTHDARRTNFRTTSK